MRNDVEPDAITGEWSTRAIRGEMVRRGLTYANLVQRLNERFAVSDNLWNERMIRNKVARGTFSAAFFIQCLVAMGCNKLDIDLSDVESDIDDQIDKLLE